MIHSNVFEAMGQNVSVRSLSEAVNLVCKYYKICPPDKVYSELLMVSGRKEPIRPTELSPAEWLAR